MRCPTYCLETLGQSGYGGHLEETAQGQFHLEGFAQPGDHLGGQQGMSAQLEEVIMEANLLDTENLFPKIGEPLFEGGAR